MFLESPLVKNVLKKRQREFIQRALTIRFGKPPADITAALDNIKGQRRLDDLYDYSIICPDLETFCARLFSRTNGS
jgi:hypothetical protein